MTPITILKMKPIPNPIDLPASSASDIAGDIEEVAINVDSNIKAANAIPRNDGINNIPPITRTTELNLATREALIDWLVLQALQSKCKVPGLAGAAAATKI
jgi:hypothetical protein